MGNYSLILLDGNNLAYKSLWAFKSLSVVKNDSEIKTGLPFGFLKTLSVIRRDYLAKEGKIIVVWDSGHAYRSFIYADYKGNRKKSEDDKKIFFEGVGILNKLLGFTCFTVAQKEGEEADDIIATLQTSNPGKKKLIVSSDKDFHQLINKETNQLITGKKDKEDTILTVAKFVEEYKYHPKFHKVCLMLMGDTVDGIKGIGGVGSETGPKMVREMLDKEPEILEGMLEGIIPAEDNCPLALSWFLARKGRNFVEPRRILDLNFKLINLRKNIVEINIKEGSNNSDSLAEEFIEWEFFSLIKDNQLKNFLREGI